MTRGQEALADFRHKLGMTQEDFAREMGVRMVTIARWETSRPPNANALARLFVFAWERGFRREAESFHEAMFEAVKQRKKGMGATK